MIDLPSDSFEKELCSVIRQTVELCGKHLSVETKQSHDYVTSLDFTLQDKITNVILKYFPTHRVMGEEGFQKAELGSDPTWVIDPLDGTSNFVFGLPIYCCSIAMCTNRSINYGFVYDWHNEELFTAIRGHGLKYNARRFEPVVQKSDFIGMSSGLIEKLAQKAPSLIGELREHGKFRIIGSQALHLAYVATGRLKACMNYEAKIWDDAAGALLVQESGGQYFNMVEQKPTNLLELDPMQDLMSVAFSSDELKLQPVVDMIFSTLKDN